MFVYAPRSGSKVFCVNEEGSHNFVRVVQYTNKSHHILGGVYLEFTAARPGHYWRHEAKMAAQMIVASYGGIAGDDRGTIFMVVPRRAAKTAMAAMAVVRNASTRSGAAVPEPEDENLRNAMACAMAGWGLTPQRNMCSVDWGLPQFSLSEFNGKDEEIVGEVICKRVGDKFSYSIGETVSWTAPWAAIGVEITREPPVDMPEVPCPCGHCQSGDVSTAAAIVD